MKKVCGLLLLVCASVAAQAPLPNTSYLGLAQSIAVTQYISSLGGNASGGGQFLGTVNGFSTSFWCVDDQLNFSFSPATALANVIGLNQITGANTHYGNVTNTGSPQWTNVTVNGDTLPTTAADRYKMTAYLISQYQGFNTGITNNARDQAIQDAVWSITNNSSLSGGFNTVGSIGSTSTVGYWVHQAFLNYASVDPTKWAAVSWVVNSSGTLLTGSSAHQTLLVQVVPEPGFYGALALGLSGLFFLVSRKRKSVKAVE